MHEVVGMRRSQPFGDLLDQLDCLVDRERSFCKTTRQRLTADPLIYERAYRLRFDKLIGLGDVDMPQRGELVDVLLEARETEGIARRWTGQDSEGNEPAARGVVRCPDFAQPAFTDERLEFVETKRAVGPKSHIDRARVRVRR